MEPLNYYERKTHERVKGIINSLSLHANGWEWDTLEGQNHSLKIFFDVDTPEEKIQKAISSMEKAFRNVEIIRWENSPNCSTSNSNLLLPTILLIFRKLHHMKKSRTTPHEKPVDSDAGNFLLIRKSEYHRLKMFELENKVLKNRNRDLQKRLVEMKEFLKKEN